MLMSHCMSGKSKSTRTTSAPLAGLASRLTGGRIIGETPAKPRPCGVCGTAAGERCKHGIVTDGGSSATDFGYVQIIRVGCLALVLRPYAGDSAGTAGAELVAMARMEPVIGAHGERTWEIGSVDFCGNDEISDDMAAEIAADAGAAADASHRAEMDRAARAYAEAR